MFHISTRLIQNIGTYLPIFFAFTFFGVVENSNKTFALMVGLSLIISLIFIDKEKIIKNFKKNRNNPLLITLALLTAYTAFIYQSHDISGKEIRALICIFIISLYFPFYKINKLALISIVSIGSLVLIINSFYYNLYLGQNRWSSYLNPIPYSILLATLLIINLYLLNKFKVYSTKFTLIMLSFFLFISILLTAVRGTVLSLLLAAIIVLLPTIKLHKKTCLIIFISMITIIAVTPVIDSVKNRAVRTYEEIIRIQSGNLNSSMGLRLQMWKVAPKIIEKNLFTGVGNHYKQYLENMYKSGEIQKSLYRFRSSHFHNQYIDTTVKKGLVGLAFLVAIFVSTIVLAYRSGDDEKHFLLGLVALYAIVSLSDVPFYHAQTLVIYVLAACCIYGMQDNKKERQL